MWNRFGDPNSDNAREVDNEDIRWIWLVLVLLCVAFYLQIKFCDLETDQGDNKRLILSGQVNVRQSPLINVDPT